MICRLVGEQEAMIEVVDPSPLAVPLAESPFLDMSGSEVHLVSATPETIAVDAPVESDIQVVEDVGVPPVAAIVGVQDVDTPVDVARIWSNDAGASIVFGFEPTATTTIAEIFRVYKLKAAAVSMGRR